MKESHREYYLLHSDSRAFKKKVEQSLLLLKKTQQIGGKWGISYSGGKDSTVVLDLAYRDWETDRKSTRLNSSHSAKSRMPSSA